MPSKRKHPATLYCQHYQSFVAYDLLKPKNRAILVHIQDAGVTPNPNSHYCDVTMGPVASQITSLMIVYSSVYSGSDKRKHQSSASLAFVRGIHRGPVNYPHKWLVTRKMFPFDDTIMRRAAWFCHTLRKSFTAHNLLIMYQNLSWM